MITKRDCISRGSCFCEKYSSIHNSSTTQNLKKSCKKTRALFEIIQNRLISVAPKNFGDFGRFAENNTKMNEKKTDYFLCFKQKNCVKVRDKRLKN